MAQAYESGIADSVDVEIWATKIYVDADLI